MPGKRTDLRWDRARHARCPERSTEDTYLGVLIGTIQRHECRNDDLQSRLQGVPDPRVGIGGGGTRGAGVTGAGPLRAASLGAAGGGRPFDLDHILAVARSVGLDAERLVRDMEDQAVDAPIERNAVLANALGIRVTPAFVICDGMIRGALPLKQFRAAIADARGAPEGARNRSGTD